LFEDEWEMPFDEYVQQIFNRRAWGDQLMVACLRWCVGRTFALVIAGRAYNPSEAENDDQVPDLLGEHNLLYVDGNHFDALLHTRVDDREEAEGRRGKEGSDRRMEEEDEDAEGLKEESEVNKNDQVDINDDRKDGDDDDNSEDNDIRYTNREDVNEIRQRLLEDVNDTFHDPRELFAINAALEADLLQMGIEWKHYAPENEDPFHLHSPSSSSDSRSQHSSSSSPSPSSSSDATLGAPEDPVSLLSPSAASECLSSELSSDGEESLVSNSIDDAVVSGDKRKRPKHWSRGKLLKNKKPRLRSPALHFSPPLPSSSISAPAYKKSGASAAVLTSSRFNTFLSVNNGPILSPRKAAFVLKFPARAFR
jgi:hypothetical protein